VQNNQLLQEFKDLLEKIQFRLSDLKEENIKKKGDVDFKEEKLKLNVYS